MSTLIHLISRDLPSNCASRSLCVPPLDAILISLRGVTVRAHHQSLCMYPLHWLSKQRAVKGPWFSMALRFVKCVQILAILQQDDDSHVRIEDSL